MEIQSNSTFQSSHKTGHGNAEGRKVSRRWVPVVTLVVIAIAVGSALYSLNRPTIPDEIEGLILYGDMSSEVVDGPVDYGLVPPAGGQHAAAPLECGLYFHPIENEVAVAALATGAIWVAYDPDQVDEPDLEDLKVFGEGEEDVFMSPYPGLPHPAVITAWGAQIYPESPTDTRIASFIRDYKNADSAPYSDLHCEAGVTIP